VDARFEPWRGRPWADGLAAVISVLGDRGLVWFLVLVSRWRRPGRSRASALRAVVVTGAVAPACNSLLKRAVGRARPERLGEVPGLRRPTTASFPSGHALAAWCAADLLAEGDRWGPAYYALAAGVSLSRVHVRHHHATDVVAGSVLGLGIGRSARTLVPLRRLLVASRVRP
jgi:undecaprenyl-diphosphatase